MIDREVVLVIGGGFGEPIDRITGRERYSIDFIERGGNYGGDVVDDNCFRFWGGLDLNCFCEEVEPHLIK